MKKATLQKSNATDAQAHAMQRGQHFMQCLALHCGQRVPHAL